LVSSASFTGNNTVFRSLRSALEATGPIHHHNALRLWYYPYRLTKPLTFDLLHPLFTRQLRILHSHTFVRSDPPAAAAFTTARACSSTEHLNQAGAIEAVYACTAHTFDSTIKPRLYNKQVLHAPCGERIRHPHLWQVTARIAC